MNCITYSYSDALAINSISMSASNSNFTSLFFKTASYANAEAKKKICRT